ncbi:DUF3857 domain-containing protein [Flavobacterium rhizosphaerae]|uniref:DUF3857 domain-containing protein n=1 Tax=Flavobacterium rhizosphaerae TaxID=3163298 RepID=A0ABW8YTW1_9FLAO
MKLRIFCLFFCICSASIFAQENLGVGAIPDSLLENANAVVRLDQTDVEITSQRSMSIKKTRIVTILNENGMGHIGASENFSKTTSVKAIEAVVYDSRGEKINRYKKKDFKEVSVSQSYEVTDNKVLYLDYTPVRYPFTVVYTSELQTDNTAFILPWSPVEGAYCASEKSVYTITYPANLGFRYKEYNSSDAIPVKKTETGNSITLQAVNISPVKREDYSPALSQLVPIYFFSLKKFHLEGVDGEAEDWAAFGKWMYDNLVNGTDELPEATVAKIKALVGNETDPLKKADIVYKYVQGKTRYVSIQLGIGGWKPMNAKDVDRLGYGDCKGLSNYTRSLLKVVGVDAYDVIIYGDHDKRDLKDDFVCMQGNHMILAIPYNNDYVWLECTSQTHPFGFQGDFTDNRMALVIKPEGGELVRTHAYNPKGNTQISRGTYTINQDGSINGNVQIVSGGLQYERKYRRESQSPDDLDKIYKNYFRNINNLKLLKKDVKNNSPEQQFTENIELQAGGYCAKSGNRIMFAVNAFNPYDDVPRRYRNRKTPFEISMGFYDEDEITITLPEGFTMEAKPDDVTINGKFGEYKTQYTLLSENQMLYRRTLFMNEGKYESNDYEDFRDFREKIARNDNAKVVLVKN